MKSAKYLKNLLVFYLLLLILAFIWRRDGEGLAFGILFGSTLFFVLYVVPHLVLHIGYLKYEKDTKNYLKRINMEEADYLERVIKSNTQGDNTITNIKFGGWVKPPMQPTWLDYEMMVIREENMKPVVVTMFHSDILNKIKKSCQYKEVEKLYPLR